MPLWRKVKQNIEKDKTFTLVLVSGLFLFLSWFYAINHQGFIYYYFKNVLPAWPYTLRLVPLGAMALLYALCAAVSFLACRELLRRIGR